VGKVEEELVKVREAEGVGFVFRRIREAVTREGKTFKGKVGCGGAQPFAVLIKGETVSAWRGTKISELTFGQRASARLWRNASG
jgi:hypothetical protein